MSYTIAIDGPVGAGKSSVADDVAKKLGILHLDTGAMYRAFAWQALQNGVAVDDEAALCALAQKTTPEVRYEQGEQRTLIGGTDVTGLIRTPEISMAASTISKVAGVRKAMVACQQAMAAKRSMLLDGRDIGTRVLPNATLKIYLTASAKVRAQRRYAQLQEKGDPTTLDEVLADVMRRDEQDMTREADPLRPAEDAQILDTSELSQPQVVNQIVLRLGMKQGKMPKAEEKFSWSYHAARGLSAFLFRTLMPITYHGVENAQMDAPFILIANHNSMLDPMVVGWKCSRYQVIFLGKRELEKTPILKSLFKSLRMIAVDRHNMDMSALRACLGTLRSGHPLGIFPEGTRHKQGVMENMESGVAMIALRSKAPLLPVYMSGKPGLFRHIHVYYGQPVSMTELAAKGVNKETCDELMESITQRYREFIKAHEESQAAKKRRPENAR